MENFLKIEKISEGSFGVVYKAKNKSTGNFVAMKKIISESEDHGISASGIREYSLLKELNHPNIVKSLDVFIENTSLFLIFEFFNMDLKTSMEVIGSGKFMNPEKVKSYLYQINHAILYCHQRRIFHKDLKPNNLLIGRMGVIKLANFGLGHKFNAQSRACSHEVVTLWYRAPELLLGCDSYSCPVDMWSIGCIFSEMATNKPLFKGDYKIDQLMKIFRILRTPTEEIWPGVTSLPFYQPMFPSWTKFDLENHVQNLDKTGMDLLKQMLVYDPIQRISAKTAQEHRYFNNVKLPRSLTAHPLYKNYEINFFGNASRSYK